jgi:hypothetical protein
MSLHKFAEQVAAQGRGDDSLLVHMTPDEVQRLQKFAEANGRSLTINPETGLPEAGFLSDLFKAVAPIALGAFLGPAGMGLTFGGMSSALSAGIATGGITTLATGSLSRGLMAGLGAYGGAGLGESLMGAGTSTLGGAGAEAALQAPSVDSFVGNAEGMTSGDAFNNFLKSDANPAVMGKTDVLSAGAKAAALDPLGFAKNNLGNLAYAAAPIMAGAMVPTTTQLPDPRSTGNIRQMAFNINPDTGKPDPLYGMREMPVVKASDFGDKTFQGQRNLFYQQNPNPYELGVGSLNQPPQQSTPMAGGGIVALAGGGDYTTLTKDSSAEDIASAYKQFTTASGGDTAANQKAAVDYLTNLGIGQDKIGQAYGTYQASPTYNAYTDEQIGSYFQTNPNADIAADITKFNANPADVNRYISNIAAPFVGSTDTTGGSGTLGIYNQMNALGIDANELYNARIAADPKYAGWSQADIARGYSLDKGALALAAADKDGVSDKEWAAFMDTNGYSVNDMAQAFGLSKNEVQRRYDAAKKVEKKTTLNCPAGYQPNADGTACVPIGVKEVFNPPGTGITAVTPTPFTSVIPGGFYGNATNPGDIMTNKDGTVTVQPNIPYRPYGGFSGIEEVSNAYTKGGGSLGYKAAVPKTPAEHNALYNKQTDDSLDAYNYLMGKGKNLTQRKAETKDRPVMARYDEAVLGRKIPRLGSKTTNKTTTVVGVPGNPQSYFDEKAYLAANPDVAEEIRTGKSVTGEPTQFTSGYQHYLMYGKAGGRPFTGDYEGYTTAAALANAAQQSGGDDGGAAAAAAAAAASAADGAAASAASASGTAPGSDGSPGSGAKRGGLMPRGYAMGGGLGSLGSYSDGGRLLKGPGDGVSDSIPATIGRKRQPARLADGEFVIPARIVSELGNGSTEAGAKKLYAMMDRVQRARGKTTGKNKVAANSRSDKYLPA